MNAYELDPIIRKKHQFKKLLLARQRVIQLERQLREESIKPEDPPFVPQFLRAQAGNGLAHITRSAVLLPRDETAALITKSMNAWGRRSAHELSAPRRLHLIKGSNARNRTLYELQSESYL